MRYASYVRNEISNTDPAHSKWSAYCSIYFTDEDADGRQQGSYVLRVSGKVDGVRLPKSIFYVSRVMQNEQPDIHIIGIGIIPPARRKPCMWRQRIATRLNYYLMENPSA